MLSQLHAKNKIYVYTPNQSTNMKYYLLSTVTYMVSTFCNQASVQVHILFDTLVSGKINMNSIYLL